MCIGEKNCSCDIKQEPPPFQPLARGILILIVGIPLATKKYRLYVRIVI